MMVVLKDLVKEDCKIILLVIGGGPKKNNLQKLAFELKVNNIVNFLGSFPNNKIPRYLMGSHVFVSPLTGTSLREAALCGLPIIAYRMDWISNLLKNEETALLVEPGDYTEMAKQVLRLIDDKELCHKLSVNIKKLALQLWSLEGIENDLAKVFGGT